MSRCRHFPKSASPVRLVKTAFGLASLGWLQTSLSWKREIFLFIMLNTDRVFVTTDEVYVCTLKLIKWGNDEKKTITQYSIYQTISGSCLDPYIDNSFLLSFCSSWFIAVHSEFLWYEDIFAHYAVPHFNKFNQWQVMPKNYSSIQADEPQPEKSRIRCTATCFLSRTKAFACMEHPSRSHRKFWKSHWFVPHHGRAGHLGIPCRTIWRRWPLGLVLSCACEDSLAMGANVLTCNASGTVIFCKPGLNVADYGCESWRVKTRQWFH
jgi:hypothetical protein